MKTINDVIQNLIEVNEKLSKGEIDLKEAKLISQNTQIIINGAKVMLDFAKFTDNKEDIFLNHDGVFKSLREIEDSNKKTVKV